MHGKPSGRQNVAVHHPRQKQWESISHSIPKLASSIQPHLRSYASECKPGCGATQSEGTQVSSGSSVVHTRTPLTTEAVDPPSLWLFGDARRLSPLAVLS